MAEWELTTRLGKFLDRHLVLTLLEFLSSKNIYDEKELLQGKLEVLKNTSMIDFSIDTYKKLYPGRPTPPELLESRQKVVAELNELTALTEPALKIITKDEVTTHITNTRDGRQLFEYLQKNHGMTSEMVDSLHTFAKFQYECGNYSGAAQYLSSHRALISPNDKNYLSNLWGKLAAEILMQQWDNALEDFNRLRDYIDNYPYFSPLQLLQQRTWLIHWSLFIYFNHTQGRDMLIDMFLEKKAPYQKMQQQQQPYLNAVQTMCPHIIRHLTVAVITNRRRRECMKELVKVIQQESYTYRDPITEFVKCLCVNFDFDGAQKKLRECADVFNNDFFLIALQNEFIESARLFVFEIFCQIHECISISMLADKLNMSPEEAECWIVNLIRQARLDAKIDSKLGHVVMGTQAVSPYQQLIEKTKAMAIRCQVLTMNIEKRLQTAPDRGSWTVNEL